MRGCGSSYHKINALASLMAMMVTESDTTVICLPGFFFLYTFFIHSSLPSSIAFLTALRPSCTASFIWVSVCLFGPSKIK